MAELYLADLQGAEGFERRVVLKRILPHLSSESQFVNMFIDEARIAAHFTHPNVVQVYDFGVMDGDYYLAMEWVDGMDLRQVLKLQGTNGQRFDGAAVACLGEGLCSGLSYVHNLKDEQGKEQQIVHRDISPHNIMLTRTGDLKIMDFGIAKAISRISDTRSGVVKGKISYMAPEQLRGGMVDKGTDQFAVGLVLWECWTGQRFFDGELSHDPRRDVGHNEPRKPSSIRPGIDARLEEVIMRALSYDPKGRYADLSDMKESLRLYRFSMGEGGSVDLANYVKEAYGADAPAYMTKRKTSSLSAEPLGDTVVINSVIGPGATVNENTLRSETTSMAGKEAENTNMCTASTIVLTTESESKNRRSDKGLSVYLFALGWIILVLVASLWFHENADHPNNTGVPHKNSPADLRTQEAVRHSGNLWTIESVPSDASLWVGDSDVARRTPAVLRGVQTGRHYEIKLRKEGYAAHQSTILLRQSHQTSRVKLSKNAPSLGSALVVVKNQEQLPTKRNRKKNRGYLSLRLREGWAWVYLGKRGLGTTPLKNVVMPVGRQRLRMVNSAIALDDYFTLTIGPRNHKVSVEIVNGRVELMRPEGP
jgi:eukaryotic-like serine/threonine-protein kinase